MFYNHLISAERRECPLEGGREIRQHTESGGSGGRQLHSPPFGSLTLCFLFFPPPHVGKKSHTSTQQTWQVVLCFWSVKSTPTNAWVVQSEKERAIRLVSVVLFQGCNAAVSLHRLVPVWDSCEVSLKVAQPYLLAVILLFLAFLFVAQVICEYKATPVIT